MARLALACRIFLGLAYPGGVETIPLPRRIFGDLRADQELEPLLQPPLCEKLRMAGGRLQGHAWRLGSAGYPHLKLQALVQEDGLLLFAVDTHDALRMPPSHPEAGAWSTLQVANRQLKEKIEKAWEEAGLLTFNGLLRRNLGEGA
jgi:hypothetical protein